MMASVDRSFDGSYAQYVSVPAAQVIPFETSLPWDVVGALHRCSRPPTDR
jgi:NADPH2:quinone reductase